MPPVGFRSLIARALPGTMNDLVRNSGCAESTIRRWLHRLRAEGECHIGGWRRNAGGPTPYYVAGPGKDARCNLKTFTNAECSRRSRARMKGTEHGDVMLAKNRARQVVERAKGRPHSWADALFIAQRAEVRHGR
jgi:hypothetical protein